ncbi:MAG: helix-hairpin-helix domain-containing protein [Saprospiraceae bacterium]|nr:helix-hairpin-helix domain-containing protein [Saprospiraceae bacterium]
MLSHSSLECNSQLKCNARSNDSLNDIPTFIQDQVESYLDNLDSEADFDFNDITEHLQQFLRNPLSLNRADQKDLETLNLLSDLQIADLLDYRHKLGNLKSIYELQSIPSFDAQSIERLLPFVTIVENQILPNRSFAKMLLRGSNELYLRSSKVLETQKGYESINSSQAPYLGNQNQYYVRFKHQFEQKLSYGFTLEKDPGEPFFQAPNQSGFDFMSFHLFARDLGSHVQALAIGDYSVSLGQGLIMHSGYGSGKSSFVTQIKRGGRVLRPYTSVNESALLRGFATTIEFKPLDFTIFVSRTRQDANLSFNAIDDQQEPVAFTSLQLSGLHRTNSEIDDKRVINHQLAGIRLAYKTDFFQLATNVLTNRFDRPFQRTILPYNQYYFRGTSLSNASIDYAFRLRNLNLFGETALSDNGALATLNGILIGLSRYIDLSILYRNISRRYQALQSSPFIESSQANNEKGIYLGSQIKFNPKFWLSLYGDYWAHPWLRFQVDGPSTGKEYFIRFTYYEKRKLEAYIQFRSESKQQNTRSGLDAINSLEDKQRQYLRIHLSNQVSRNLELRNRVEFSLNKTSLTGEHDNRGFLIYQDFIFKSLRSPLSFTARACYFDADDFSSRIYAYENDILYSFSIPAFYNQGFRYYLNLRYRIKGLTIEARFEQTRYRDIDTISSGNELINGNTKSRIKVQFRYAF